MDKTSEMKVLSGRVPTLLKLVQTGKLAILYGIDLRKILEEIEREAKDNDPKTVSRELEEGYQ